jgi:hypothetical protein
MRLPAEALQPHLAAILEGILLWASDSKNKFKLKVIACRVPTIQPFLHQGQSISASHCLGVSSSAPALMQSRGGGPCNKPAAV